MAIASISWSALGSGAVSVSVVTSNTFMFLQGPVLVHSFLEATNGTGGPSTTLHPEIYYSYDRTNWYGDYTANNQTITTGTNLYEWVVSFPAITSTNSTGFYIERRFKVGTATGATHQGIVVHIGTNNISGVNDASHISFSGPSSAAGNAYLANSQTFTGSNTLAGDTVFEKGPMYLLSVSNAWDATNFLVEVRRTLFIQASNVVGLTNFTGLESGNGNGIIYQNIVISGVSNTPPEIRFPTNAQFGVKFRWMGTKPTHATNDSELWIAAAWRGTNGTFAGGSATGQ